MSFIMRPIRFASTGHIIEGSVTLDVGEFLHFTPSSAGNRKTFTIHMILKNNGGGSGLFSAKNGGNIDSGDGLGATNIHGLGSDGPQLGDYASGWNFIVGGTSQTRDFSAFYDFLIVYDSTQGSAANRVKFYINGTEVAYSGSSAYPALNAEYSIGNTVEHNIGAWVDRSGFIGGFQLARFAWVDGAALTPAAFGETTDDGFWQINEANVDTWGDLGVLLEGGSNIAAGTDTSGEGNDWGRSATLTTTNDSPTNGGDNNEYGNYTVFDAGNTRHIGSAGTYKASGTISNGNRTVAANMASDAETGMTILLYPGQKYHVEWTLSSWDGSSVDHMFLRLHPASTWRSVASINTNSYYLRFSPTGSAQPSERFFKNSSQGTTNRWNNGDRMSWDIDMSTIGATDIIIKNDGSTEATESNLAFDDEPYMLSLGSSDATRSCIVTMNNGSEDFSDTPVAGHLGISTANSPTPDVINYEDHYTVIAGISHSNGSTTSVTLPWNTSTYETMVTVKRTDSTGSWYRVDTLRGGTKAAQMEGAAPDITNSDGGFSGTSFVITSDYASGTYLLEATKYGLVSATAANEEGSINTLKTTSNNDSKAFMLTWTGTTSNGTLGHGLDVAPDFIVACDTDTSSGCDRFVFHKDVPSAGRLFLDTNAAADTNANGWQNTAPTTTLVSVGTGSLNGTGTSVMWGYASSSVFDFGIYDSNLSADGPMINLSGSPATFGAKRNDGTWNWVQAYQVLGNNENYQYLENNNTTAVNSSATVNEVDFLSNGIKMRDAGNNNFNGTAGADHYYYALGIQPIQGDGKINQGRAR